MAEFGFGMLNFSAFEIQEVRKITTALCFLIFIKTIQVASVKQQRIYLFQITS